MIAIIPARGGSKGLPGKNIRPLCGKPLIAHTIDCARQARSIERVIVSTDDQEIAEIARQYGAVVPFLRPDHLASDSAQAVDAYLYTISRLSQEEGIAISEFAVLLPTCPLRLPSDIEGAVALFREKQADSVVSYTPEAHPVRWHRFLAEDGSFEDIFPPTLANRQEERMSYYPNGAIYVFRSEIIRQRRYYTDKSYAYVMPRCRSVDIDSLEDFAYAEYLMGHSSTVSECTGGVLPVQGDLKKASKGILNENLCNYAGLQCREVPSRVHGLDPRTDAWRLRTLLHQ